METEAIIPQVNHDPFVDPQLWQDISVVNFDPKDYPGGNGAFESTFYPKGKESTAQLDGLIADGKVERGTTWRPWVGSDQVLLSERARGLYTSNVHMHAETMGIAGFYRKHGMGINYAGADAVAELESDNMIGNLSVNIDYSFDEAEPDKRNLTLRLNLRDLSIGEEGIGMGVAIDLATFSSFSVRDSIAKLVGNSETELIDVQVSRKYDPSVCGPEQGLIFGAISLPSKAEYPRSFINPSHKMEQEDALYSLLITSMDRLAKQYWDTVVSIDPAHPLALLPYRVLRNKMAIGMFEGMESVFMPDFDINGIIAQVEQIFNPGSADIIVKDEHQSKTPPMALMASFDTDVISLSRSNIKPSKMGLVNWKSFFEKARDQVNKDNFALMKQIGYEGIRKRVDQLQGSSDPLGKDIYTWIDTVHRMQYGDRKVPVEQRAGLSSSTASFDVTDPIVRVVLFDLLRQKGHLGRFNELVDALAQFDNRFFTMDTSRSGKRKQLGMVASRVNKKNRIFFTRLDRDLFKRQGLDTLQEAFSGNNPLPILERLLPLGQ